MVALDVANANGDGRSVVKVPLYNRQFGGRFIRRFVRNGIADDDDDDDSNSNSNSNNWGVNCTVQDLSFKKLVTLLNCTFDVSRDALFACGLHLPDDKQIYTPNLTMPGIGPVDVLFSDNKISLIVHPSIERELVVALENALGIGSSDDDDDDDDDDDPVVFCGDFHAVSVRGYGDEIDIDLWKEGIVSSSSSTTTTSTTVSVPTSIPFPYPSKSSRILTNSKTERGTKIIPFSNGFDLIFDTPLNATAVFHHLAKYGSNRTRAIGLAEAAVIADELSLGTVPVFPRDFPDTRQGKLYYDPSSSSSTWNVVRAAIEFATGKGGKSGTSVNKVVKGNYEGKIQTIDFDELVGGGAVVVRKSDHGRPFVDLVNAGFTPTPSPKPASTQTHRRNRRKTIPQNGLKKIDQIPKSAQQTALELATQLTLPALIKVGISMDGGGVPAVGGGIWSKLGAKIGRIVSGGFSFGRGYGVGVGFVGAKAMLRDLLGGGGERFTRGGVVELGVLISRGESGDEKKRCGTISLYIIS